MTRMVKEGRGNEPGAASGAAYAVGLLTVIYTLNFLDRQIVSILASPLKTELQLSNTEFALISGLAFAVICRSFDLI